MLSANMFSAHMLSGQIRKLDPRVLARILQIHMQMNKVSSWLTFMTFWLLAAAPAAIIVPFGPDNWALKLLA
jgi:hypothetical protein